MTTRPFWLFGSLLALMLLAGLFTRSTLLLALAFPLLAYLGLAIFLAPAEPQLKATRTLSTDRITQGLDITVGLRVVNEGAPTEELHLSELMSLQYQSLQGHLTQITALKPAEAFAYEYTLQGWRGNYRFEGLLARVTDPFGLFEIRKQLPATGNVLVYPEASSLKSIPIRPPQTKGFSGPIPSRKNGTGLDFFGVRQYQLGDSLQHINWKTSARHSVDLFTNEYEQERIADVSLILDARPHCDVTFQERRLFEYSVQAAASLAEMFLNEGHCLSLLIYSAAITRVFPGYGKVQRERIMKALAHADTGINYAMEHLRYFPVRLLPPRGQLLYISPLADDDLEPLIRFRTLGYHVLIVSPDPLHFEQRAERDQSQPDFQLALRFAQAERNLLFNKLRRAGIQMVNWQIDQPLSALIDQVRIQNTLHQRTARILQ